MKYILLICYRKYVLQNLALKLLKVFPFFENPRFDQLL